MKKLIVLLSLSFTILSTSFATHNRAGEITYSRIDNMSIEGTIYTYTVASSISADRDTLQLCWGDGVCEWIARVNGPDNNGNGFPDGEIIEDGYRINIYKAVHTYASQGNYTLHMTDPNRNTGILNVNFPNSEVVPFHIETECRIDAFLDHSPQLLQAPIDKAYIGKPFMHTPNAFDINGDSIAYALITPLMELGTAVPNFLELDEIGPSSMNTVSFDEETGLLIWDAPQIIGEYNIAYEIKTYRAGELIGRMVRDMQIVVEDSEKTQPTIEIEALGAIDAIIDVQVGDLIEFQVSAEDADPQQQIMLTSTSGLYLLGNPPVFTASNTSNNVASGTFTWTVSEDLVRGQPYQLVFRVVDELDLANYIVLRYKVHLTLPNQNIPSLGLLDIYPNPVSEVLYIKEVKAGEYYRILDNQGRLYLSAQLDSNKAIDVNRLPSGIYLFQVGGNRAVSFVKE